MEQKKGYIVLENGESFEGVRVGADIEAAGEVVFTTSMTGYNETLTDKSYYGQIIVQTFPLIGNYGTIGADFESGAPSAAGYITGELCANPSNFRCGGTVARLLTDYGIPGLTGVDTRSLTRLLRSHGTMKGVIADSPDKKVEFELENAVEAVSVKEIIPGGEGKYRVALYDFGFKENIRRELIKRGCSVTVCPFDTPFDTLRSLSPDGVMLSNGPGDPAVNTLVIAELAKLPALCIPVFGICLGHQLLALANGFRTEKLAFGHRGANQPVRDIHSGKTYITSQNHGYAVSRSSIDPAAAVERFVNVNDSTDEGIEYLNCDAFSVQFHPEGCGGPRDTGFLFDEFIGRMSR